MRGCVQVARSQEIRDTIAEFAGCQARPTPNTLSPHSAFVARSTQHTHSTHSTRARLSALSARSFCAGGEGPVRRAGGRDVGRGVLDRLRHADQDAARLDRAPRPARPRRGVRPTRPLHYMYSCGDAVAHSCRVQEGEQHTRRFCPCSCAEGDKPKSQGEDAGKESGGGAEPKTGAHLAAASCAQKLALDTATGCAQRQRRLCCRREGRVASIV